MTNLTSCPAPTHVVAHAPRTGRDDLRILIPEVNRLILSLQPLLETASVLCEKVSCDACFIRSRRVAVASKIRNLKEIMLMVCLGINILMGKLVVCR